MAHPAWMIQKKWRKQKWDGRKVEQGDGTHRRGTEVCDVNWIVYVCVWRSLSVFQSLIENLFLYCLYFWLNRKTHRVSTVASNSQTGSKWLRSLPGFWGKNKKVEREKMRREGDRDRGREKERENLFLLTSFIFYMLYFSWRWLRMWPTPSSLTLPPPHTHTQTL